MPSGNRNDKNKDTVKRPEGASVGKEKLTRNRGPSRVDSAAAVIQKAYGIRAS